MCRLLSLCLVVGCTTDPGCPDPDNPVGGRLQCHTLAWLQDAGFTRDQIVVDATTITEDAIAQRPGWTAAGAATFMLGDPSPYLTGQRIVFDGSGTTLASFTEHGGAGFLQMITVAPDGTVSSNATQSFPR